MTSDMLDYERLHVHASVSRAWLIAAGSFAGQGGTTGGPGPIGASQMFRHHFESEWNQQRHEREVNEWVRNRQFIRGRAPQHRIRRAVGRSIVSIGRRLAAEPARSVARPR